MTFAEYMGKLFSSIYIQLPIVIAIISLVYSATRYDDWPSILWESVRWARNMLVFLVAIGVAMFIVSLFA